MFFFSLFYCVLLCQQIIRKVQVLSAILLCCRVTAFCQPKAMIWYCSSLGFKFIFIGRRFSLAAIDAAAFSPLAAEHKISIFAISSFRIYNWCHAFNLSHRLQTTAEFIDQRQRRPRRIYIYTIHCTIAYSFLFRPEWVALCRWYRFFFVCLACMPCADRFLRGYIL